MQKLVSNVSEPETREEFETWVKNYPLGYVINRKSSTDVTMHYGKCGHFKGNVGKDLVTNRKLLSRNRRTRESY